MKAERKVGQPRPSEAPSPPATPSLDGARAFHYHPQLDGVRAFAVLAVVAAHAELPIAEGGGIGVDVFFVLSGYLITTLLLQEFDATGTISMRHFYARRARRLLPALLFVAAFSLVAFSVVRPFGTDDTRLGIVASILYISCWFRALGVSELGWFGHTWSLSVEEHFYVLWPPVLLLMLRRGLAHLRTWMLGLLALAVVYRVGSAVADAAGPRLNGPDMRADQLLAGCALAVLLAGGQATRVQKWDRVWAALVVLSIADLARMVVFPYAFGVGFVKNASIEVVALESAIVTAYLVVHATGGLSRVLSHPALVWTGRRSYAIYLWHLPLFGLLSLKSQSTPVRVVGRATAVVLTFVAAWASFRWVESPFYRRRVEEPQSADDGAPPPALEENGATADRALTREFRA
jgi:peptidoglycan/LPS O-acetylase OafA/YrhL